MTMQEQYDVAEAARQFLKDYGLIKQNVAQRCSIPRSSFYSWLNHNCVITEKQLNNISDYMTDYKQRMS